MNRVIKTDGTETELIPTGKKGVFTLDQLQAAVGGGYIKMVNIPKQPKMVMLVDEDGLSKGLPVNYPASGLVGRCIVGPVAVIDRRLFK